MITALAVAATISVAAVVVYVATDHELRSGIDQSLQRRADDLDTVLLNPPTPPLAPANATGSSAIGPTIAPPLSGGGAVPTPGDIPCGLMVVPERGGAGTYATLHCRDARAFDATNSIGRVGVDRTVTAVLGDPSIGRRFSNQVIEGAHVRVLTIPYGSGALSIGIATNATTTALARLKTVLILVTVIGAVVAALIGLLVATTALRPVRHFTAIARTMTSSNDLGQRIASSRRDELGVMARSIDELLETVERSVNQQRGLVADVSHELRTPLTSLRTNVSVLSRSDELSTVDRAALARDIDAQIAHVGTLIGDVIELARDPSAIPAFEMVALDEIAIECVEQVRRHFSKVNFAIETESAPVMGSHSELSRAISNLLDNAGKWSSEGSTVAVIVTATRIEVVDEGPGVRAVDQPHVFERFWRAPSARSRPGSGLGLAIVEQVAQRHGARAFVESVEGEGSRFGIDFARC